MSLTNKLKTGIALTGLGIGNLFYNTGCVSSAPPGEVPLSELPAHLLGTLLSKPGVKETLAGAVLGLAAGNTSNADSSRALVLAGAVAQNQANRSVNESAGAGYAPVQRNMKIYEAVDSNGDGIINVEEYKLERYNFDRSQLIAVSINNDRKPTFLARVVVYKSGMENPVADWKNLLMEKNHISTLSVDQEKELSGPGDYGIVVYDGDKVTAGKTFKVN